MVTEEELAQMNPDELAEFQKKNCVFCQISAGSVPAKKVYEDEKTIAILDINPAAKGHMLLLPKEHYSVMPQMPEDITKHLFMVAKGLSQASLRGMQAKGTTIFVANGVAAGQRAPHFMAHIIPRTFDDNVQLAIPVKEFPKKDTDAIQKVLKKALAAKSSIKEAEIVKETPEKKKKQPAKEKQPKKKTRKKVAKENLDDITKLFT